jgi:DNA-binding XRE family transcriptional regulator
VIILPQATKWKIGDFFMSITLAELIRGARLRLGDMTQKELARLTETSTENITAIENGRNRTPSPEIVKALAMVLDIEVQDIYASMAGSLNNYPWERAGDLDLKDPELELMFRKVDSLLDGEAKDRVKAFIRFTLDEDRRRRRRELEERKQGVDKP